MAPLAVSVTFPPGHIVGATGITVTVGVGFTVTATVFGALAHTVVVPVTVYVVEMVGLTFILEVVAPVFQE